MTEPLAPPTPTLAGAKAPGANAAWLIIERVVQLVIAFGVSIVVARLLGPADYGQLAVATSVLLLTSSVLNPAVTCLIRDVIAEPDEANVLYSASTIAVGIISAVTVLATAVFVALTVGFDSSAGIVILVVVGSSLLRPLSVFDAWFKIRLASKTAVIIRTLALIVTGSARLALPILGFGVVAVAWTYVAEAGLASIGLWIAYRRMDENPRWEIDMRRVRALIKEFMPLLVTSSSALVFMRLDQVMVAWLSGFSEAGLFAVASSLAEAPRYALLALFVSLVPRLLKLKNSDPERYQIELLQTTRILVFLGYVLMFGLALVLAPLAPLLLGSQYGDTGIVIFILALTTPVVCIGGLLLFVTNWDRLYKEAVVRNIIAALLSIGLNFLLVPKYGAIGAAITTFFASVWVYFLGAAAAKGTRAFFWMTLPTLNPIPGARLTWQFIKRRRSRGRVA